MVAGLHLALSQESMIVRLARVYIYLLLALEALLFASQLVLHASVCVGAKEPYSKYGAMLFRAAIIVGIPAIAFVKDSLQWKKQIARCPEWMWKAALMFSAYGLLVLCMQSIFPEGRSLGEQTLTVSSFPLGLDAISFCVLYSVLWSGALDKDALVTRTRNSLIIVALGFATFFAYRSGYLHHPRT